MSDQYLQQLDRITETASTDLVPISDDPAGTGRLKAITVSNLLAGASPPAYSRVLADVIPGPSSLPTGTGQVASYNLVGGLPVFAGWITPITSLSPITLDSETVPAQPKVGINATAPVATLDVRQLHASPFGGRLAQFLANHNTATFKVGLISTAGNLPSPSIQIAGLWSGFEHPFKVQFNVTGDSGSTAFGTLDWSIGPYTALSLWSRDNRPARVGINNTAPFAQLVATPSWFAEIGFGVKLAAGQTADAYQIRDSTDSVLTAIGPKGSFKPSSLADADAPNGSLYYSTTAGKLAFKDSGGTVNSLY